MAMPQMIDYLSSHYALSEEFRASLKSAHFQKTYPKGHIIYPGKSFYSIYFINKGLAKGAYESQDGKEHITRLWQQGQAMLLGPRNPAPRYGQDQIVLLEDCVISGIQPAAMMSIYQTFPEAAKLASKILLEDIRLAAIKSMLCALPALEAYTRFTTLFPAERFLLRDIAAYLEITPSTLSEIRRKRN
ncbi:cAMP-binding domain of CRP or a regulatory subunit of cAMP-dependent protein kinases [Dyadobacter soli]|uniref:cAMP-binding domain of CRP or a regulatory subunit of cAMP-dependent protein kinases n=1 Tax=Dyadobacter soli TaxID=659014 RepID=A0A1G7MKM8_9BACT|nr:Crp/Fnr family transcriptional regulator [Dyadobacter soli]SDF61709.1 cAMP-binding domain of CRP or a regulatory subunit of cAMP-dependent protein kinases [Dyadobacter soli]